MTAREEVKKAIRKALKQGAKTLWGIYHFVFKTVPQEKLHSLAMDTWGNYIERQYKMFGFVEEEDLNPQLHAWILEGITDVLLEMMDDDEVGVGKLKRGFVRQVRPKEVPA